MNFRVIEKYVCPTCHGALTIQVQKSEGQEILNGSFSCITCARNYAIQEGIPIFWQYDGRPESFSTVEVGEKLCKSTEDLQAKVTLANQIHHDRFAPSYDTDPCVGAFLRERTATQSRIQEIINYLSINSRAQLLLDVGCGTGNVLKFAQQNFDNAIGADISLEMLRIAHGRGMEVCLASADHLPFRGDCVDAISCFSVLHHFAELKPVFIEFTRILTKDGYLYTDWDPSSTARQMQERLIRSRIYNTLLPLYRLIRNSIKLTQRNSSSIHANHPDAIEMFAEFHNNFGQGLDETQIKSLLSAMGFQTQLYWHDDFPSFFKSSRVPLERRIKLCIKFWLAFQHLRRVETAFPTFATLSRKI